MRPEVSSNLENCVESSHYDDAGKASAVRGEVKIRKVGGAGKGTCFIPTLPLVHPLF